MVVVTMLSRLNKCYSELIKLLTHKERFEYLKLHGGVSVETFGYQRYLNQNLYNSHPWRTLRNKIIVRDCGFDMALDGFATDRIVIHHINPITIEDFEEDNPIIWDPENLICVDDLTHRAIHYGDYGLIKPFDIVERRPNDTSPWRC